MRALALTLLLAFIAGCSADVATETIAVDAVVVQDDVVETIVPAIVEVREAIEAVMPVEAPRPPVDPRAVALIVRFEVTSPSYYDARLRHPIWPGAQSGVTWGIGYDGGHQTRTRILEDWRMHAHAERLAGTSGIVGPTAKALLPGLRDVLTPYALAQDVFALSTLPIYADLAERTFHNGWNRLPEPAKGSLVATVYNRGAGMSGDSRREMRVLRDECVPAADTACMAAQYRSMPRLWVGTTVEAGLRARYEATAQLAEVM